LARELRPNDIAVHATRGRRRLLLLARLESEQHFIFRLYTKVQHEPSRSVFPSCASQFQVEVALPPTTLLPRSCSGRNTYCAETRSCDPWTSRIRQNTIQSASTTVSSLPHCQPDCATRSLTVLTRLPYRTRHTNAPKSTVQHVPKPAKRESRRPTARPKPTTERQVG
jgi:hypothetical protein